MKGNTEEHFVTKQDLKIAAQEIVDAIRAEYLKVIESNKKVMAKVDRLLSGRGGYTGYCHRVDQARGSTN